MEIVLALVVGLVALMLPERKRPQRRRMPRRR
jgi:hypothetical protein